MSPISSFSSLSPNSFESSVSSFLSFPDSSSLSISSSFDRVLHNLLSSTHDSLQDQLIDRTLQRVSLLLESTKQCSRKRATLHNSISWLLPLDLTIKVFSMLDTKSVIQASACCTMFNKYAMDPSCYTDIDLTTAFKHADDGVLSTLIHRVGNKLRSLKLGCVTDDDESLLTSSCLTPLVRQEYAWNHLRSLHIYHLPTMDDLFCSVLSICTNLTDLKFVGLNNDSLSRVLVSLQRNCRLIEHLFLNTTSKGVIYDFVIEGFESNCPNLTSLTLINIKLNDATAQTFVTGFRKLKYMDLSRTSEIHGSFLRNLGHNRNDSPLETLILRDCYSLEEREVSEFLHSLNKGDFKFIRYIDVSSKYGLASCLGGRTSKPGSLPLEMLKENRAQVTFVADFPSILQGLEDSDSESSEDIGFHFSESEDEDVGFHLEDSESDEDMGDMGFGFHNDFH